MVERCASSALRVGAISHVRVAVLVALEGHEASVDAVSVPRRRRARAYHVPVTGGPKPEAAIQSIAGVANTAAPRREPTAMSRSMSEDWPP